MMVYRIVLVLYCKNKYCSIKTNVWYLSNQLFITKLRSSGDFFHALAQQNTIDNTNNRFKRLLIKLVWSELVNHYLCLYVKSKKKMIQMSLFVKQK